MGDLELGRLHGLLEKESLRAAGEIRRAAQSAAEELDRLGRFAGSFTSFGRLPRPRLAAHDLGALVDELAATYEQAAIALIEGGADFLMIETIFDTLNAKAAILAVKRSFAATGVTLPVMISGTITDASGRTLSGQTTEAFWISLAHAEPLVVGLPRARP